MEHNGERLERTDESDARKRATPYRVGAARPRMAATDTTGTPERRKGVDVERPHRRHGSRPSRMAGKEGQRKATEPDDRISHEPQQGASEASGQPQPRRTRGTPPQREKKRKSQTARPKKKTRQTAPSAKGTRSVDGGRGRRPPDPRKKEKGVGVEATQTECAAEGAREARPRPSLLRGTRSRTRLEPA